MSSKGYDLRNDLPLEEIYDEVLDHMKTHGHFDNMRVSLIERIWSHPCIKDIEETFESECESWVQTVDLSKSRQELREKLTTRFESYSRSRSDLKHHISRCIQEQKEEIKTKYYEYARNFLERYLPKPSPDPDEMTLDVSVENESKQMSPSQKPIPIQEPKQEIELDLKEELQADIAMDMDMDIESLSPKDDDDEEVEKPPYSPIGNSEDSMDLIKEPNMTAPSLDEIPIPPEDDILENTNSDNDQPIASEVIEIKRENSEPPEEELLQQDDNDDKDTFSSISTVGTADLSDFDNSITLSDVEAFVVGKPKNSKVPIKEIQDNIKEKKNDLQNTNLEIKAEQIETNERIDAPEAVEASESDGGCSESTTTGRRLARTRKSNPRYSNEHYKLYN